LAGSFSENHFKIQFLFNICLYLQGQRRKRMEMVIQNDPFWDYVEKLDDDLFKCIFCAYKFVAATSVSRIKWHLSGLKGRGVKLCDKVPEKVQDAARAAVDGPPEKKHKVIAGSSNNDVNNAISTSAQEQNYEGRHVEMAQQGEAFSPTALKVCLDSIVDKAIEFRHDASETIPRTKQVQNLKRGSSLERPSINQADGPQGDSSPPKDLSCLGLGSYHDQPCSPSVKNDVIMDDVQNIVKEKTEPVASMLEQSNAILNKLAGDDGRIQVGVQGMEQGAEEELICSHPEAGSGMENTYEGFIQHVDRNVSPGKLFIPHRLFFFFILPSCFSHGTIF
jgi:hypothetical protein